MAYYTKIEKEILALLRDIDISDIKSLGHTIQTVCFCSEKSALLVDCTNCKVRLFYPILQPYKHEDRIEFAKLVSLLTFIETLEKKGLIYLEPSSARCEMFFYENFKGSFYQGFQKDGITKYAITLQERIVYDIDEDKKIDTQAVKYPKKKSDFLFIAKDGHKVMQSTDASSLYDRIYSLLCSRAFPTSALSRFIDNGYCFDEEKRSIKSLRYAKISVCISMFALLVSPCISVWYSNRNAYSTIDTCQYNALIKKLDVIDKNGKTIDVNSNTQGDSIKRKIRNIE